MAGQNTTTFKKNLGLILTFDEDRLIKRDEWGTANFEEYKNFFDEIFFITREFLSYDIEYIPDSVFPQPNQHIINIYNVLKKIDNYDVVKQTKQEIDSQCDQLPTHLIELKKFCAQWLPILAYRKGDIDEKIKRMGDVQREAEDKLEHIKKTEIDFKNQSQEILQAMRDASASAGVATFNKDFENAAKDNNSNAKFWGWFLLFSSLITIGFPIYMFFSKQNTDNLPLLISSKILIMVVLITASLWIGKMYKAAKHQEAINKFKANALRTFQAFIKATDDEQTKNAVLLETTKAIFTGFNPGYITLEQSPSDSLKIMEVFKNISKKE